MLAGVADEQKNKVSEPRSVLTELMIAGAGAVIGGMLTRWLLQDSGPQVVYFHPRPITPPPESE